MKYEIKVQLKPDVLNTEAKEILHAVHSQGFDFVHSLNTSKAFTIEVAENTPMEKITEIAQNILANEVIENFTITNV